MIQNESYVLHYAFLFTLADPPNGRGPMIFYAPHAPSFFRSRFIQNIVIAIWQKHADKMTYTSTVNTFNAFLPAPPR